jgi:hypothetical protein
LVTDLNNRSLKFPKFDSLLFSPAPYEYYRCGPVAVAQDHGDLIVAESVNRSRSLFPGSSAVNGAHFEAVRPLAPGGSRPFFRRPAPNSGRNGSSTMGQTHPLPQALADIQVLLDGIRRP